VTVTESLELARLQGVEVTLDGDDLVLKAEAAPPPGLLAILGRGKWDIVAALRLREAIFRAFHRDGLPSPTSCRSPGAPVRPLIPDDANSQWS
jgi:hypothetical protein